MGQHGVCVLTQAGAVWSAMSEDVAHPRRPRDVLFVQAVNGDDSSYAAHGRSVEQAGCH
jgi:hypothetical protein